MKKISEIMSQHHSFAAWTRIPIYDFKSGHSFGIRHGAAWIIITMVGKAGHVQRNCHSHCLSRHRRMWWLQRSVELKLQSKY
jgi:hypothetical protein